MTARSNEASAADLATEVGGLATGLGMVTMIFFPFALPCLLLALPLLLPLIPLVLVAGLVYLLARILLLPVRMARRARQRRSAWHETRYAEGASPGSIYTAEKALMRP